MGDNTDETLYLIDTKTLNLFKIDRDLRLRPQILDLASNWLSEVK